jgi:putative ABC transport system substrate-binding protein
MKRRRWFMLASCAGIPGVGTGARAQTAERVRRVAILMPSSADDPEFQARVGAFLQEMGRLGWSIGRNLRLETRWATARAADIRRHAADLAVLAPDVILAFGAATVGPLLEATRTVPIVFPILGDPVASGFVESLARPGGNATGLMNFEYTIAGKWLELLKEIAPRVIRVAVLRDPAIPTGPAQLSVIQAVAPLFRVEAIPVNVRDPGELERTVERFGRIPDSGLIVTGSSLAQQHRDLIVALASQHRLPGVYFERSYVVAGGLISYGPDFIDQFRRSAGYVDRILKGEKPGELPVQAPTKFETAVNLGTARALGLAVPPTILARADEVIE